MSMAGKIKREYIARLKQTTREMSLMQVGPIIFGSTDAIITFLRRHGLLAATKTCTRYIGHAGYTWVHARCA